MIHMHEIAIFVIGMCVGYPFFWSVFRFIDRMLGD